MLKISADYRYRNLPRRQARLVAVGKNCRLQSSDEQRRRKTMVQQYNPNKYGTATLPRTTMTPSPKNLQNWYAEQDEQRWTVDAHQDRLHQNFRRWCAQKRNKTLKHEADTTSQREAQLLTAFKREDANQRAYDEWRAHKVAVQAARDDADVAADAEASAWLDERREYLAHSAFEEWVHQKRQRGVYERTRGERLANASAAEAAEQALLDADRKEMMAERAEVKWRRRQKQRSAEKAALQEQRVIEASAVAKQCAERKEVSSVRVAQWYVQKQRQLTRDAAAAAAQHKADEERLRQRHRCLGVVHTDVNAYILQYFKAPVAVIEGVRSSTGSTASSSSALKWRGTLACMQAAASG
jgi:hypothetical protein